MTTSASAATRLRGAGLTAAAALTLAVLGVLITAPSIPGLAGPVRVLVLLGGSWLAFGIGALLVQRLDPRAGVVLILAGGVALPLLAGIGPPRGSDDLYRYLWDGRVQAAGIDAYRYVPAAPELVALRDEHLWPEHSPWCVPEGTVDPDRSATQLVPGCTLINRPTVHTIYPPAAQALFLAVGWIGGPGTGPGALQLVMAAFAVATTVLLLVGLRWIGADPRRAVLWAWCPLIAVEAGSNAHVDVVAALLTALALLVLARARTTGAAALGGGMLGLAVATKLTPVLVAPALVRRRPLVVALAAGGALAVLYLPHVLAVGPDVIGYLPGYLAEEGYTNGSRFALLTLFLPQDWAGPAAVVLLVVVAVLVARAADPNRPWLAAAAMTAAALLVATPSYSWYAILLVALVALGARAELLVVGLAGEVAQYAINLHIDPMLAQRLGYGGAVVVVAVAWLVRPIHLVAPRALRVRP